MSIEDLARDNVRALTPYQSALAGWAAKATRLAQRQRIPYRRSLPAYRTDAEPLSGAAAEGRD
ncbi:hypothetical protein MJ588_19190 [Klebsiella pneumoniae]|nr:hypothetical protein MJ588_19190 [Klebsiella pneumoniae]